ncbi:MAG: hypothetical protein ACUVUC_15095, partial [Thermoguttaceae bacterium]
PWVLNHQTPQATFLIGPAYGEGGQQAATLLLEIAGHKEYNIFGIYDPNSDEMIPIFPGSDAPITSKRVAFKYNGSTYDVYVGDDPDPDGNFASTELGFYLQYDYDNVHYLFYSEDRRNGDNPQSLILFGDPTGKTYVDNVTYEFKDVIVAFEDLPYRDADKDYQDMVVFIDFQAEGSGSIIPEPTSLAIWGVVGLGAAGLASLRGRRKLARWSDQDRQAIVQLIQGGRQR